MSVKNLADYNIVIAIDKSGSMAEPGVHASTRWEEAKEATIAIARKADTFDADGITVIPFAGTHKIYDNANADKVAQIFQENEPNGSTDTAGALKSIFDLYTANPVKPIIVVVITDGEPNDQEAVKKVIRDFAATLTDNGEGDTDQAGILFLQVGNDPKATQFLTDLDDNLGAKFDIVDTKTTDQAEGLTLTDLLLQALEG